MSSKPRTRGVSLTEKGAKLLRERMIEIAGEEISDKHLATLAGVTPENVRRYRQKQKVDDSHLIKAALDKVAKPWTQLVVATIAKVDDSTVKAMLNCEPKDTVSIERVTSALGLDPRSVVDTSDWSRFVNNQPEFKGELSNFQALIHRKLKRFVGRRFVFDAIENFFSTNSNGYFTIVGEPGIGKSTILAKYITDNQCVGYFINREKNKEEEFLKSICNQLLDRYNLGYDSLPDRAINDSTFLDELLQKVSKLLPPGERLVIAVDALDEREKKSEEVRNICYLPKYLPDNVYFLLTRRPFLPEEERLLVEAPKHNFNLWKYPKESEKDVKEYIWLFLVDPEFENGLRQWIEARNLSKEEFTDQLAQKSKNNFMYLRCVLSAIANGEYQDKNFQELPEDLQGYYQQHWQLMGMTNERQRHKVEIIYILVELALPVSCQLIADIAEQDIYQVQEVLEDWIEFFSEEELKAQICYSIYHSSFVDFLHDTPTLKNSRVTLQEINGRIAKYLLRRRRGK
ncbi:ATP-binding protein [Microcoleus sp. D2_18a_B4]|uniref:ATP-binding protein n=1 Tax=Microcoleus sp. D2_18a_B4 TaxID=3055329 RepID=UPI002FD404F3